MNEDLSLKDYLRKATLEEVNEAVESLFDTDSMSLEELSFTCKFKKKHCKKAE